MPDTPKIEERLRLPPALRQNTRQIMCGLKMMDQIPPNTISVVFLDPQYRGVLDKLRYGNEGELRGQRRTKLRQMLPEEISRFVSSIDRILLPSGHLFMWVDKFHLLTDVREWYANTHLEIVDMITWNKDKMGMGYRTRRTAEYLIVLQKTPKRAKGVWKNHSIRDIWTEKVDTKEHPHAKPISLITTLIESVTDSEDWIVDPAAGSYQVMNAAIATGRNFIGCDING